MCRRELNIEECFRVTDFGIAHISNCLHLVFLCMAGCDNLTDDCYEHFYRLKSLKVLDVRFCSKMTIECINDFILENSLDTVIVSNDMVSYQTCDINEKMYSKVLQIKNVI